MALAEHGCDETRHGADNRDSVRLRTRAQQCSSEATATRGKASNDGQPGHSRPRPAEATARAAVADQHSASAVAANTNQKMENIDVHAI